MCMLLRMCGVWRGSSGEEASGESEWVDGWGDAERVVTSGCTTNETAAVLMRMASKMKWMTANTTSWGTSWAQLRMPCPSSAMPAHAGMCQRRVGNGTRYVAWASRMQRPYMWGPHRAK